MGQVASELLAGALADADPAVPAPTTFVWDTADLGEPRGDLEDAAALRRILDQRG